MDQGEIVGAGARATTAADVGGNSDSEFPGEANGTKKHTLSFIILIIGFAWFFSLLVHRACRGHEGKNNEKTPSLLFPECVARVPVSFGGVGVRLCSRKVVSVSATVRNRPQPSA